MEHQQIVHTVIDQYGAYAFMPDATAALTYAAKVHGQIGPIMTRQQAHELVEQSAWPTRHGTSCVKAVHVNDGYLHAPDDDTPYDVDGCRYCGRCHVAI